MKPSDNPWLPIETAPKDGTKIDILQHGKHRETDVVWNEKYKAFQHGSAIFPGATHWMPIPKAPKLPS